MDDIFSVSPVYQWTLEEGIAIGEAKGKAEGSAEVLAQMRQPVIQNIFEQFPSLTRFAKEVLDKINEPGLLYSLAVNLAQAQSTEDAHQILLKAQLAG